MPSSNMVNLRQGRVNMAEAKSEKLNKKQLDVMELLLIGESQRVAAERIGVAEETVSRWCNHNDAFEAELQRRRQDTWDASRDRLLSLSVKALDVLEEIVTAPEGENAALRASLAIVKALGMDQGGRPEDSAAVVREKKQYAWLEDIMPVG